jgi:hypothetical protein
MRAIFPISMLGAFRTHAAPIASLVAYEIPAVGTRSVCRIVFASFFVLSAVSRAFKESAADSGSEAVGARKIVFHFV